MRRFLGTRVIALRQASRGACAAMLVSCAFLGVGVLRAEVVSLNTPGATPKVSEGPKLIAEDDAKLLEPANAAFMAGNRAEFDAQYKAAQEKSANLPALEIYLAKLLIETGRLAEAIQVVEVYLRDQADDPEAFVALGEIAMKSGRWTDAWLAVKHADRLVQDKKLRSARLAYVVPGLVELQAIIATQRLQWDEAEALFKKLGELRPEQDYPLWRVGHVQLLRGNAEAGIKTMTAAHQKNSALPSPELTAALFFAEKDDPAKAEEMFKASILKDVNDPVRWNEYLKWLVLSERAGDAAKAIAKVPEKAKSARSIRVMEGFLARLQGDLVAAEKIFAALTQEDVNDAESADQLALVLIESADEGKRGRALQLSELNLRRANTVQSVIATAAWVQYKLGAIDVADRLLAQLASQAALQPQSAYYVARVLESKGQVEDARRVLKIAVDTPGLFVERSKVREELAAIKN